MTIANDERALVIQRLRENRDKTGELGPDIADQAAEACGVHRSTIYRWVAAAPAPSREPYTLTEEDKLQFFRARGNASLAFVALSRQEDPRPPSLSTYRRALRREFDAATMAAAKHGARERAQLRVALRDRHYRRNERWEADHTQLEVEIIPPASKNPRRPWVTWVIDAGSRYVGGWAVSLQPTRGEVLSVIRLAVENAPERGAFHGRPDVLVWDNGLEFTANAVTDCALMLGSYAAPTFAYTPEKKPKIERINQTIEKELLARLPFYTRGPRGRDGKLYGSPGGRLSLEQLVHEVAAWVDHYNCERAHSGIDGKTPLDAWLDDANPIVEIPTADLRRLTLERRMVKVSHDAGVTVNRRAFVAPELNGHVRRRVEVGLLPHDYSRAEVFLDGKWLCTAKPASSLTQNEILEHKRDLRRRNSESARLLAKTTRASRARYAPMTPEDPAPRALPPDPALRRCSSVDKDRLGFGDEIGEVE